MSKINLQFKNKKYEIDKSFLDGVITQLDEILERMRCITFPEIPGLYERGTYYKKLLIDWNTLVADGVVHVTDGVVTTNYNFYENSSAEVLDGDLALPEDIIEIGKEAFAFCRKLDMCIIPTSVRGILENAFWNSGIKRVVFAEDSSLEIIQDGAFSTSQLEFIVLPDGVLDFGIYAFASSQLKEITIPIGITLFPKYLFQYCGNLKKINYKGIVEQWLAIEKEEDWYYGDMNFTVYCTDGKIAMDGTIIYYPTNEEPIEGNGQEFHQFAPTALSFRSTEPLEEFKEVQVNGETVDPENYTLEEGSTIVTLKPEYLKTLGGGNYEIAIVSQNKTASGKFDVTVPEVNEYGFYYNQPYTGYVEAFGAKAVFFIRENNTLDAIIGRDTVTSSYIVDGDNIVVSTAELDEFRLEISNEGLYCNELGTPFVLGDEYAIADENYIYFYNEDGHGYEVIAIDKTKIEYESIKTGINGHNTIGIGDYAFYKCTSLINMELPEFVRYIGKSAFYGCNSLKSINIPYGMITIQDSAFSDCKSLINIEFPDTIRFICGCAFYGCDSLTSIELPCNLHVVDVGLFEECNSLERVVIPPVYRIDNGAFYNCTALKTIIFEGDVDVWNNLQFGINWNTNVPATYVQCADGKVDMNGNIIPEEPDNVAVLDEATLDYAVLA